MELEVEALLRIADGFLETRFNKEALLYFDKALALQPDDPHIHSQKGVALYGICRFPEALECFTKAIALDSRHHSAYFNRGSIYYEMQEYALAKEDFLEAQMLEPDRQDYCLQLALTYQILKLHEETLPLCDKLISQNFESELVLKIKAHALSELKYYNDSITLYQYLINLQPHDTHMHNGLGFCYIFTGAYAKALESFQTSIDLKYDYAYPWDNMGYVYFLEKQYDKALQLIDHSIELDASNSWAYKNRAIVYHALNKMEEAKADLLFAIELGYTKFYDDEAETLFDQWFNQG